MMQPDPRTADPDTVIRIGGVGVRRSGSDLLADLDWTVELDERWVILGPNGAGKTTLLKLAAAEMHPTTGTVELLGERLGRVDVFELRPRIGLASASLAGRVPPDETAFDVVRSAGWGVLGTWRERYDETDDRRAAGLMEMMGVAPLSGRHYGTLSTGERQRVLLARALMTDPELLLLDEPAAGLDLGAREDLVELLSELAADPDGPATVMVTHHVEEIPPNCSHAMLLREGRVVAQGLLDDVMTSENLSATFDQPLELTSRRRRFTAFRR
ncbi:iron complex transport system ATP-binding protein [Actinomycetospora succinea]|uniref:Iron complex transport system ATP-binding protein n=1 Tax=Actinomycetospora succinea TaxID=663603 RepID=A0A4R6VS50_9PSEU|nr:iron complex transport system ATP-binding protein [Actinomycetospora succinea]